MFDAALCLACLVQALILLLTANGAPILAKMLFNDRFASPVDAGLELNDAHPVFGVAKTWRGVVAAVFLTGVAALLLGMQLSTGAGFAVWAMAGDLSASFIKRRLGFAESSRLRVLDTLPESLLPAAILKQTLGLGWLDIVILAGLFFLIEELVSPLLHRLHIRKRPY